MSTYPADMWKLDMFAGKSKQDWSHTILKVKVVDIYTGKVVTMVIFYWFCRFFLCHYNENDSY